MSPRKKLTVIVLVAVLAWALLIGLITGATNA